MILYIFMCSVIISKYQDIKQNDNIKISRYQGDIGISESIPCLHLSLSPRDKCTCVSVSFFFSVEDVAQICAKILNDQKR